MVIHYNYITMNSKPLILYIKVNITEIFHFKPSGLSSKQQMRTLAYDTKINYSLGLEQSQNEN